MNTTESAERKYFTGLFWLCRACANNKTKTGNSVESSLALRVPPAGLKILDVNLTIR